MDGDLVTLWDHQGLPYKFTDTWYMSVQWPGFGSMFPLLWGNADPGNAWLSHGAGMWEGMVKKRKNEREGEGGCFHAPLYAIRWASSGYSGAWPHQRPLLEYCWWMMTVNHPQFSGFQHRHKTLVGFWWKLVKWFLVKCAPYFPSLYFCFSVILLYPYVHTHGS